MADDKKVKFIFQRVTEDTHLIDQNVISWQFVNKGTDSVSLNKQLTLEGAQPAPFLFDSFEETISAGEKTATSYRVVFAKQPNRTRNLFVIMKMYVND